MTTKECIEFVKGAFKDEDLNHIWRKPVALQKLISLAEQVEGVRGIEDKNFNAEVCAWRDNPDAIKEIRGNCKGFNQANSQWRALIVGRFGDVETIIHEGIVNKSEHISSRVSGGFDKWIITKQDLNKAAEELSTAIRNLFLGEIK